MNETPAGSTDAMKRDLLALIASQGSVSGRLQKVCDYLCGNMRNCHWAGYYLVDPSGEDELFLGPYCGEKTQHDRIAFGEGICGQAASGLKTFIISDVSSESNYLSCSPEVRSEIVVPVFHDDELVGEIDLDSHVLNGFDDSDRELLEWLSERTSALAHERSRMGQPVSES